MPTSARDPKAFGNVTSRKQHVIKDEMLDLFGEVIVTEDDIHDWVEALAPAFLANARSFELYVRGWRVADKVRAAKRDGTFDETIESALNRRDTLARRLGVSWSTHLFKR
ncbi:hypothetical protein [Paraburkholderia heleia]|uniref:hypothetical protein n=1 Tax=Paraburkholderia heleia TaxID=634127 RepID=UPI0031DCEC0A